MGLVRAGLDERGDGRVYQIEGCDSCQGVSVALCYVGMRGTDRYEWGRKLLCLQVCKPRSM